MSLLGNHRSLVSSRGARPRRTEDCWTHEASRSFHEMYRIHVDQFLELRDAADDATAERLGVAPKAGELVSDEWFDARDVALLGLWNERFTDSARAYCDLITDDRRDTP